MNCVYSVPINLGTEENPNWAYSVMNCEFSELENPAILIQSEDSAEFYLDKTISYGDLLLLVFLSMFLIFGIVKFLTGFLIPQLMNFKRK